MSDFSITGSAFTGFRVVREHPKAVVVWALAELASMVAFTLALGPALNAILRLPPDALQDIKQVSAAIEPYRDAFNAVWILALPFNAILNAAMNRAVLRPNDDRFGYLRLGLDELRQLGLMLVMLALLFLGATLTGLLIQLGGGSPGAAALALTAGLGLWVYLGARLSLASALTFETGRIDLVGAWRLSRGRIWPLLATYGLAVVMSGLVLLLSSAVIDAAVAVAGIGSGGLDALSHGEPTSISQFLQPAQLANLILSAVAVALVWPVWLTPPAAVYASLGLRRGVA